MNYILLHKNKIISGALVLLLLFIMVQWVKPHKVAAYSVKVQDYIPSLLISGEVIAHGSTVLSAMSAGTVTACPAAKGDQVKKGQLLVQIDDSQALLELDRASTALQIAQAQLQQASTVTREAARADSVQAVLDQENAEIQYKRIKALHDAGAVSLAELEQAEQNLKMAEARAQSAQAALDALEQNGSSLAILQGEVQQCQLDLKEKQLALDKFKIVAVADGELLDVYVNPGESLVTGSKAVLLAAGDDLRIRIKPDQRYAELAASGNQGQVWIANEAALKWDGQVVFTEPAGDAGQGSLTAELSLSSPVPQLYPGQLVSVQLFGPPQKGAIILPDSYLTVQAGESGVWVSKGNRAHFTPVQIGLRTPDGVVITQGLGENDLVLEPSGLQENQKVSPQLGGV